MNAMKLTLSNGYWLETDSWEFYPITKENQPIPRCMTWLRVRPTLSGLFL